MAAPKVAVQRQACEWSYISRKPYGDPFNEVELDVVFTHEDGESLRLPCYWGGDREWRVRFAPPKAGTYEYSTRCTDVSNADLHEQKGTLEAAPYAGENLLLQRGSLRLSSDKRHFEHEDGTPFFWLGDTWWMGLSRRWSWPEDFKELTADRKEKGFTLIQIVAGLYPDMLAFDRRGANEAGFPWEEDFGRINPAYFDEADLRIQWLVKCGLVPCIFACWGWYIALMGVERMKKHWRYLIARWGAYPVVWCLAGEGLAVYYESGDPEGDREVQRRGWTAVGQYLRANDPYRRLITIHPSSLRDSRDQLEDSSCLDFGMLQLSHRGYDHLPAQVRILRDAVNLRPRIPVVNAESNYEGIKGAHHADVQRFGFWSSMLSGAAGFTYGANGMWQINRRGDPFGPSPHGAAWGNTPWEEACQLPGGRQVALGRRILDGLPWRRFEPRPEWIEPAPGSKEALRPLAAGIPSRCRVFYLPTPISPLGRRPVVKGVEAGRTYRARYVNPADGEEFPLGEVRPNRRGEWEIGAAPIMHDLVLIMD